MASSAVNWLHEVIMLVICVTTLILVSGILYVGYLIWLLRKYIGELAERRRFRAPTNKANGQNISLQ